MSKNNILFKSISIVGLFVLAEALSMPNEVYADDPIPAPTNGTCTSCHEDLYYLHDTGYWFCLNESPMTCVDCHGGNSNTLDKDLAHNQRSAHPVINDDVTKCQQCHPAECNDRVKIFGQTAGISNVLVAAPYTPPYLADYIPTTGIQQEANSLFTIWEIVSLILVTGLTILIYIVARRRQA